MTSCEVYQEIRKEKKEGRKPGIILFVTPRDCCIQTRLVAWPLHGIWAKCGVWTGYGQRQYTPSRRQVSAMGLRSLWYPYPSLHVLSLASACN